ncbi:hypothetical protein M5X11_11655 [Paenibacillus alginolyticus]|uniref:hypothetical protein n=1 Tax=Paenibacillus alginolyticus TaxID=59839 RepID=UPI000FD9EFB0|nr:hypothetical protein [Paenibacillus alginolyticus]MCY9665611.1 hypothetical protein [Paenibacillus alginolyticus]
MSERWRKDLPDGTNKRVNRAFSERSASRSSLTESEKPKIDFSADYPARPRRISSENALIQKRTNQ